MSLQQQSNRSGSRHPGEEIEDVSEPTYMEIDMEGGGRYKGAVKVGIPHGEGEEWLPNEDHYVGEFQEGKKHGNGRYTFADGSVFTGEFFKNEMCGRGVY